MPGEYKPLITEYTGETNVLIRLTRSDSVALLEKLKDAISRDTGVSFVFLNMKGAVSLTNSDERKNQIKCIAYDGARVTSEMKGYSGVWSHVELAMDPAASQSIRRFLDRIENRQVELPMAEYIRRKEASGITSEEKGGRPWQNL